MTSRRLHDHIVATVLTTALVAAAAVARAEDPEAKAVKGKEKCYGVAKAGENGCQSHSGSHTCGGCSAADYRGEDWKWVPSGTCVTMGGQLQPFDGFGKMASMTPVPKAQ